MADDVWSALVTGSARVRALEGRRHGRHLIRRYRLTDKVPLRRIPGRDREDPPRSVEAGHQRGRRPPSSRSSMRSSLRPTRRRRQCRTWPRRSGRTLHVGGGGARGHRARIRAGRLRRGARRHREGDREPEPTEAARQHETQIKRITEPWSAPFRNLAAGSSKGFDELCKAVLGIDNAGKQVRGPTLVGPRRQASRCLLEKAEVAARSARLRSTARRSRRSSPIRTRPCSASRSRPISKPGCAATSSLKKIIPGEAPTADADTVAITLDTKDGLTFGDGKKHKIDAAGALLVPAASSCASSRRAAVEETETQGPHRRDDDGRRQARRRFRRGRRRRRRHDPLEGRRRAIEVKPKPPSAAGPARRRGHRQGRRLPALQGGDRANTAACSICSSRRSASLRSA